MKLVPEKTPCENNGYTSLYSKLLNLDNHSIKVECYYKRNTIKSWEYLMLFWQWGKYWKVSKEFETSILRWWTKSIRCLYILPKKII
jgi:hypothetical protein